MQSIIYIVRDDLADFIDFWRPLRAYFHWEPHCYDIPGCWSIRRILETFDAIDQLGESMDKLFGHLAKIDSLMPKLLAEFPSMIETMEVMRTMMLSMHSTMAGIFG